MIDATIVPVPKQHLKRYEKAIVEEQGTQPGCLGGQRLHIQRKSLAGKPLSDYQARRHSHIAQKNACSD